MTLLPILLPEGFSIKVSAGDKVAVGQILAEGQGSFHEITIHLAHELKLVPQRVVKTLQKNLGDSVTAGDVLAVKKSLLGSHSVVSEFSGIITKVDTDSGDIVLRVNSGEQNLKTILSPVVGSIDSVEDGKIILKTDKQAMLALDGIGGEATGAIEYLADSDERKLSAEIKGKILLTKDIDKVYVFKTIGLEAAGIITQDLVDIDFIDLE
jgi:hypothetical protein